MELRSIDLSINENLKNKEFRQEWFRAELEDSLSENFRAIRELRGLTQGELADLTGMRQSAVSRFEKSSTANWSVSTLLRIAEALDAKLSIMIEPSELAIQQYEKEKHSGRIENKSVIEARRQKLVGAFEFGDPIHPSATTGVEWQRLQDKPVQKIGGAAVRPENESSLIWGDRQ